MSPHTIVSRKFTRVLVKKQLGSRQRQLGKTAVVKAGAYVVSMDRKTSVYGLEDGKIAIFKNAYKLASCTAVGNAYIDTGNYVWLQFNY